MEAAGGRPHQHPHHAVERLRLQWLADHAGRREEHFGRLAARGLAGELRGEHHRLAPGPAGGVGAPELTERLRPAPLSGGTIRPAPRAFRAARTFATAVPLSNRASSTSVRLVLDAGGAGRRRTPAISGRSGTCFGARGRRWMTCAPGCCRYAPPARGRALTVTARGGDHPTSSLRRAGAAGAGAAGAPIRSAVGAQLGDQVALRLCTRKLSSWSFTLSIPRLALALVLDLDDMPAELRLHRSTAHPSPANALFENSGTIWSLVK